MVRHIRRLGVSATGARIHDVYLSKVEIVLDQGTWRVKEVGENGGSRDVYDGALTSQGPIALMVMKDRLLGLPRTITVLRQGARTYEGVATAAYFPRLMPQQFTSLTVKTRSARIALK